jgi:hypothetical protein
MADEVKRQVRKLYDWEIEQVSPIFAGSLNFEKIRICEGYGWPDYANRFGRFIRRQSPPGPDEHNSITLGNHCYWGSSFSKTVSSLSLTLADIEAAIRPDDPHHPRSRLVCLENTHNRCGGTYQTVEYLRSVGEFVHQGLCIMRDILIVRGHRTLEHHVLCYAWRMAHARVSCNLAFDQLYSERRFICKSLKRVYDYLVVRDERAEVFIGGLELAKSASP